VLVEVDLQGQPNVMGQMMGLLHEGYDVVYGTRIDRPGGAAFNLATVGCFHRLFDMALPFDTGACSPVSHAAGATLKALPEHFVLQRYVAALAQRT
jgi:hypothetical protein